MLNQYQREAAIATIADYARNHDDRCFPEILGISAIATIADYARNHDDRCFPEILGISYSRGDVTNEQWYAAVAAVAPLFSDERLVAIMFHIAEAAVMSQADNEEVP